MRDLENTHAYPVEVSAAAWTQLSRMSLELYQRIRGDLDALGARFAGLGKFSLTFLDAVGQVTTRSLQVEDYVIRYDVDPERRRLTLLEVSPRFVHDP